MIAFPSVSGFLRTSCFRLKQVNFLLFLLLAFLIFPGVVYAQIAPSDLGRIEEQLTPEMRGAKPPGIKIPQIEGLLSEEDAQTEEGEGPALRFEVNRIEFQNNTVFSSDQFEDNVKVAIGKAITLGNLRKAAANITKRYHEAGYPFARAFIPQQTLRDGHVVTIEIIEGYIADVEFRGVAIPKTSKINAYAEELKKKRPVKREDLEKYVLLINEVPGIQARAIMSLVEGHPGVVNMVLLIDQNAVETGVFYNNGGSAGLGPFQGGTYYKINDLTGFGDQLIFNFVATPGNTELRYRSIEQNFPIGNDGDRLSFSVRHTDSIPGKGARMSNIVGRSDALNISYFYSLIKNLKSSLMASFSFDVRSSSTKSFDVEIINDRLRIARAKLAYRTTDTSSSATSFEAEISRGFNVLGASPAGDIKLGRAEGRNTAAKATVNASHFQQLSDKLFFVANAESQWTHDRLLSAEMFGVGGREYGRGFDYSSIVGDRGYAASLELNYKLPISMEGFNKFNMYGFIDGGRTFDDTQASGQKWQGISSVGIGYNIGYKNLINITLEAARPLALSWNRTDVNESALHGYVGISLSEKF